MIPLQPVESVKKFPFVLGYFCIFLVILNSVFLLASHLRQNIPTEFFFVPANGFRVMALGGVFFFPHFFSLFISLIFIWVFCPRVIERRGFVFILLLILSSIFFASKVYQVLFPNFLGAVLLFDVWIGACLGAYMRRDIWGTVNTLVVGPGWIRVLEVPSYVQLFFWFFYQLISNLMLPEQFSNTPMPYFLGFFGFLFGFLFDSIWGALKRAN